MLLTEDMEVKPPTDEVELELIGVLGEAVTVRIEEEPELDTVLEVLPLSSELAMLEVDKPVEKEAVLETEAVVKVKEVIEAVIGVRTDLLAGMEVLL